MRQEEWRSFESSRVHWTRERKAVLVRTGLRTTQLLPTNAHMRILICYICCVPGNNALHTIVPGSEDFSMQCKFTPQGGQPWLLRVRGACRYALGRWTCARADYWQEVFVYLNVLETWPPALRPK